MMIEVQGAPVVYLEQDGKPYEMEFAGMDGVSLPVRQGDMFQDARLAIDHYKKLFGEEGHCTIAFGKDGYAVVVGPSGFGKRKTKSLEEMKLPDEVVKYMTNLPKEVQGKP